MDQFIDKLLQEQGVPDDLDPQVRQELAAELTSRAVDFMNRRLVDAMDENALNDFQALLDTDPTDPAVVQDFITAHVADRDKVIAKALIEFRSIYLGDKA
jgi:hypothetical protein